ncbi:linolenate hydroperoxide lyase, chloroplastic [Lolium perenne]|uniref:linolenate hydroperoxide lyase, chloroplastic n=1 Tax=Lolium perenne TaxID=4522 RepID=UPI0021EAC50F|nr:linolenate hydroperoxide lyase, chloroplastic [Lolium perenne]
MLPSFSPAATAAATPPRPIPGGYGIPVLGPLRDRLDYFWFQGPEEFFRRRAAQHKSTVFRANIPPTFPFFLGVDPRVVAIVDTAAFTALFDNTLVDKRDCLIGPYNPSDSFTGGTRVGVYLDTEEPEHARTKAYAMELLRRSSRVWAPEFLAGVDTMLTAVESDLAAGKEGGASFLVPLQQCIFRFLCKAVTGADPAAESLVDRFGFYILDVWLGLQLVPTQKIGAIPQPLEELLLHSFPFPSIIVKPGYDILYRFIEKHGAEAVAVGVDTHGLTVKDAVNNILFVLGFNAFGGFSVFLPFLVLEIGKPDAADLRTRLRDEVRAALQETGGEVGFAAVAKGRMPLVRSTVYEVLRTRPPVPLQFGRARQDFVLRSHGGEGFAVSAGEMLCGYQPLAMRDPAVFDRPEEFVADRFVGEEGEKLLSYVYWSNGPETDDPALGNKQCAAKDAVIATACMLVAELFRRYDDFQCQGTSFTKIQKRQPS